MFNSPADAYQSGTAKQQLLNHAKDGGARVWCAGHSASQRGAGGRSALEIDRIDKLLTTITLGV